MDPKVKSISATSNFMLNTIFDNGEYGIHVYTHLLDFGVFKELK